MKKLNIGLFIDTFYPMIDGVVVVVDNYAKRLTKYANVFVFAPMIPGSKFDDSKLPYQVIRCKSVDVSFVDYSLPLPDLDPKFKKQLDSCCLDLVHIHSPATIGRIGVKYAKQHHIPVVATLHSQYRQDFLRTTKSKMISNQLTKHIIHLFDQCDECWTLNQEVSRIFVEDYGLRKKPILINNATDMETVDADLAREKVCMRHQIDSDCKILLFVGRINKLKNIELIIDSLPYLDFPYKMLFIGSGQDEEFLKDKIWKNKLEDQVILVGRVAARERLAEYYAAADLFLFPSLYDANSLVQIEAASQHTPTLFVYGSATASKVTENVDGFFVDNDVSDYSNKIREIFLDKDLYQKVSEGCYSNLYIRWDDEVKRIYDAYLQLVESREK
ncbi:MAG: glycosyltransferase [Bacilli bacterium]|nr:glycosyltransferase [Bacilli bacterium]